MWEDLQGPLVAFTCVEPAGVTFRKSPANNDEIDASVCCGPSEGDIVVGEIVIEEAACQMTAKDSSSIDTTNLLWYRLSDYVPSNGV